jgi:hypothetical protein
MSSPLRSAIQGVFDSSATISKLI